MEQFIAFFTSPAGVAILAFIGWAGLSLFNRYSKHPDLQKGWGGWKDLIFLVTELVAFLRSRGDDKLFKPPLIVKRLTENKIKQPKDDGFFTLHYIRHLFLLCLVLIVSSLLFVGCAWFQSMEPKFEAGLKAGGDCAKECVKACGVKCGLTAGQVFIATPPKQSKKPEVKKPEVKPKKEPASQPASQPTSLPTTP